MSARRPFPGPRVPASTMLLALALTLAPGLARPQASAPVAASAVATPAASAPALPASSPGPQGAFFVRAAACDAALEIDQFAAVDHARREQPGARAAAVQVTALAFTYAGVAYKRGLRKEEADRLLAAARLEQRGWPAARHAALVGECRREAQALLDDSTGVEKWLVNNRATARVDKLIAAATARAASAAAATAGASAASPSH